MPDIKNEIPAQIIAGDSLSFVVSNEEYPADENWTLSCVLLNSSNKITLQSTQDGEDHLFEVTASTTASYPAGDYKYTSFVTGGAYRHTVGDGNITILPDPAQLDLYDGRSHAEICLANINLVLEGKASADNYSYSIGGRSLSKYSWEELISAKNYYGSIVSKAKKKASGKTQSNLIKMRFV